MDINLNYDIGNRDVADLLRWYCRVNRVPEDEDGPKWTEAQWFKEKTRRQIVAAIIKGKQLEDADANEKVWRFFAQDGQLFFDLRNDTNSNSLNWLEVRREGLSINNVNFTTKSFTINDNKVLTSADISNLVTRIEQLEKRIEELSLS